MSALSFSVVICAYSDDRWLDLQRAVASVEVQTRPALETVVVVDHNPALLARARAELASVRSVANGGERGLSGARNSGVDVARGDVIAFLDDDATAADEWLEHLAACYADDEVIGAGGSIEPMWPRARPPWFPPEFDWVVGCTYRGMPSSTANVRNLIGANMSLRRETLAAVAGFRSGIGRIGTRPVGCEETELCIRALQRWPGRRLVYEPRACVSHRVDPARAGWRYFLRRCYAEGQSKAQVARLRGARDALATERAYTLRVLPLGLIGALREAVRQRRPAQALAAAAIVAGLSATTVGYAAGQVRHARARGAASPASPVPAGEA
ncbi:MAG: glucosyl-dolichyl phosphate glucuronosyltransferase [Gaiellaceae bacterium]|nr:glucosyl-dolichyl phosphate glucuronosyltransferase [Gaiellaceae bacterium]